MDPSLSTSRRAKAPPMTGGGDWPAWVPLLVLLAGSALARPRLPAWVWMWTLASALFWGFKWLTWWRAGRGDRQRSLAYLGLWPGMDAARFMDRAARPPQPTAAEWRWAVTKTAAGAALVWIVARAAGSGLTAGWIGMIGLVLMLHFGFFHLVSVAWRRAGVDARPLMHAPLAATSLLSFWSDRWNRAFTDLARVAVLRPLRRLLGAGSATLVVFLFSGVLHELVISVPARGGFGLPFAYFVLQGLGVLAERSRLGGRLGLGRGPAGWLFTAAVVAGPLFWLFHPPFVRRVVLPMMDALGAL